jgi:hypothetical protein
MRRWRARDHTSTLLFLVTSCPPPQIFVCALLSAPSSPTFTYLNLTFTVHSQSKSKGFEEKKSTSWKIFSYSVENFSSMLVIGHFCDSMPLNGSFSIAGHGSAIWTFCLFMGLPLRTLGPPPIPTWSLSLTLTSWL